MDPEVQQAIGQLENALSIDVDLGWIASLLQREHEARKQAERERDEARQALENDAADLWRVTGELRKAVADMEMLTLPEYGLMPDVVAMIRKHVKA